MVLTIQEVAKELKCSTKTVQRSIESGQLKAFRINKRLRVSDEEIQKLIAGE